MLLTYPLLICGKTGIRTLGTVARSPHFECGPIDHSGIFPFTVAKIMEKSVRLFSVSRFLFSHGELFMHCSSSTSAIAHR